MADLAAPAAGEYRQHGALGIQPQLTTRTVAITMITPRGQRVRAWNIDRAFPVKWTGPSFAVTSTDVPTEELEIAHHGFSPRDL